VALSAGLVGMALGSLILAPLGDVIGRRKVVLGGLVLMTVGMLLSAFARSLPELAGLRVLTGLGIGIMVAVITSLAAEFANARQRAFAVSAMAVGYPIGGVLGGFAAAALLRSQGWPSIFLAGAAVGLVLLLATAVWLPESPAFLITRQGPKSLPRFNALLRRFGHPPIEALPPAPERLRSPLSALFAPAALANTLSITAVNLLFVMAVYYVLSWLPQMVADAGFPPSAASQVSAVANLAGVVGGVLLGLAARRAGAPRLAAGAMLGLAAATAAFGYAPASLPLLMLAAGVCGFFLFVGIAGLYSTLAVVFAPEARTSGAGFVIGVGRAGSALAPYLAGVMFAAGLSRGQVSLAFGGLAALAGVLLVIRTRQGPAEHLPSR